MPKLEGITRLKRPQTQLEDPLTAEFVKAGRELIEEALQHDPEAPKSHPFLRWISQEGVVAQVNLNKARRKKKTTDSALRDRWERQSHYIRDLVDHIRKGRVRESFPVREAEEIGEALESDASPSQLVRAISRMLLISVFGNEYFRLRLVTLAALGAPKYRDAAEEESAVAFYREVDAIWEPLFEQYFEKYGLKLRVGVDMDDLVQMATAFGEGLALRELADPTSGPEREDRIKLHGDGLLAFVGALTEPNDAQSVSIDKAVDGMAEEGRPV